MRRSSLPQSSSQTIDDDKNVSSFFQAPRPPPWNSWSTGVSVQTLFTARTGRKKGIRSHHFLARGWKVFSSAQFKGIHGRDPVQMLQSDSVQEFSQTVSYPGGEERRRCRKFACCDADPYSTLPPLLLWCLNEEPHECHCLIVVVISLLIG